MSFGIPLSYNPINISKLVEVLTKYEGQHHNQLTADFETEFKRQMGAPHAVALNSGTAAIHLALKVLGIGKGDTVIAPSFTYVATINPILYVGAEAVFVDSEPLTWNMDPALLEDAIKDQVAKNRKPKGIIVVHTYGMPSDMHTILEIGKRYEIPIIEDSAESLGSHYKGISVGLLGDVGIFSFNNNKVITTYGGGMLVSKHGQLVEKARFLASQARENLLYYEHKEVGFNYALSPLCAAYGLSQLVGLEREIELRRKIFERYHHEFSEKFDFQGEREGVVSNRWFTTLLLPDEEMKAKIASVLREKGIETRPLWKPMHLQPVFKHYGKFVNGTSQTLFKRGVCLPSGSTLTEADLTLVAETVTKCLE